MAIKENNADKLQSDKLRRERELAPHSKICDIVITVLFCLFIGGFILLHIITPDREFSDRENKMLEQFPKFSSETLFSGEFTADMTNYLSDQFPMRDSFISIKANAERLALRCENGGIIFGENCLTARNDKPDMDNLKVNLDAANKFTAAIEKEGIPTIFAPAPRRSDVCIDDLPATYGELSQNKLWEVIDSEGATFKGNYKNLRNHLRNLSKLGDDLFYRTDHHWNTLGAYNAYMKIWESLPDSMTEGKLPRNLKNFTLETVTEEFYGTSYSSSGASWIEPDSINLYRFEGDDTIPVTNLDNGETYEGLYRFEYLDVRDKYSVFLGENVGRLMIGTGDRPTILMIKDSYAQSVAPFLAADFDILMVDPRSYKTGSIYRLTLEESPDAVVILMNADTLTTSSVLYSLLRGVS